METESRLEDGVLTLRLKGELDHHGAASVRKNADAEIEKTRPKKVVLCLSEVCFCDSSGLGLIMGRYRKAKEQGAVLTLGDPSPSVERMVRLAGLDRLIKTERREEK